MSNNYSTGGALSFATVAPVVKAVYVAPPPPPPPPVAVAATPIYAPSVEVKASTPIYVPPPPPPPPAAVAATPITALPFVAPVTKIPVVESVTAAPSGVIAIQTAEKAADAALNWNTPKPAPIAPTLPYVPLPQGSGGPSLPYIPLPQGGSTAYVPNSQGSASYVPPTRTDVPNKPTAKASDGNQATSFDMNLPPQHPLADDSHVWNDPAPVAMVKSAVKAADQKAIVASNPGIAQQSLWTRILTFLGFIKPTATATHAGEAMTVEQAAGSLVRRIRNGDQNAMGLVVMIGDNARKGDPKAQATYQLIEAYIGKTAGATHAGERRERKSPVNSGWARAVYLANGPNIGNERVAHVASTFGSEQDTKSFVSGVILPTYPAVSRAHHHGKIVGMARKLQDVRKPNSRISDYSATVGWELGE